MKSMDRVTVSSVPSPVSVHPGLARSPSSPRHRVLDGMCHGPGNPYDSRTNTPSVHFDPSWVVPTPVQSAPHGPVHSLLVTCPCNSKFECMNEITCNLFLVYSSCSLDMKNTFKNERKTKISKS